MTGRQIDLVQQSFEVVKPNSMQAARLFYQRLFELDASLRPMFRGDSEEQGRKLMQMLGVAVGALRRMDQVLPAVADLGRRHAGYGVRDEHYATVAAALLWTLDQGLGDAFTPDVRAAWIAMFETVTGVMRQGATAASAA
jgi:hemoglobin-like flavoprotein